MSREKIYRFYNLNRYEVEAILIGQNVQPHCYVVWSPSSDDSRLTLTTDEFRDGKHRFYHYAIAIAEIGGQKSYCISKTCHDTSLDNLITKLTDPVSSHFLHTGKSVYDQKDKSYKLGVPVIPLLDLDLSFPYLDLFQMTLKSLYATNNEYDIRPYAVSERPTETTVDKSALEAYFSNITPLNSGDVDGYRWGANYKIIENIHSLVQTELHLTLNDDNPLTNLFTNRSEIVETRKLKHLLESDSYFGAVHDPSLRKIMKGIREQLRRGFNEELRSDIVKLLSEILKKLLAESYTTGSDEYSRVQPRESTTHREEISRVQSNPRSIVDTSHAFHGPASRLTDVCHSPPPVEPTTSNVPSSRNSELDRKRIIHPEEEVFQLPNITFAEPYRPLSTGQPTTLPNLQGQLGYIEVKHITTSTHVDRSQTIEVDHSHESSTPILTPGSPKSPEAKTETIITKTTFVADSPANDHITNLSGTTVAGSIVQISSSNQEAPKQAHTATNPNRRISSSDPSDLPPNNRPSSSTNSLSPGEYPKRIRPSTSESNLNKPKLPSKREIRYEQQLGEGHFAKVYKANINGTIFAIKVINPNQQFDVREAQILLGLKHQNIVKCHGVMTLPDSESEIIFEYMSGGALESHLKSSVTISLEQMKEWIKQIANGMKYIESQSMVHRDLAARNILLNETKETVKIGDFGLARRVDNNDLYCMFSQKNIPVRWQSLEVLEQMNGGVNVVFNIKNDVWSFGVLMFEIYSYGRTPYEEHRENFKVYEYLRDGDRLKKPTNTPDNAYDLMLRCWTFSPEERPSFEEIYDKLSETN